MASPLRNLGAGLLRGTTADVLGMPVDTLNMVRQAMASPAAAGNPYARRIAGLLGPVMQTGTGDYFAQQMGLPQGQGLLYEGARMVSPSPTDLMSMARRVPIQELITYHGTPHRFEPTPDNPLGEFEAAKIGTGEGAQAYGHGVYLAENPKIAEEYRERLSGGADPYTYTWRGQKYEGNMGRNPITHAISLTHHQGKNVATQIAKRGLADAQAGEPYALEMGGVDYYSKMLETARQLSKKDIKAAQGSLYTADLPDEMIDRMLDWDKPLSEQPEAVRKALIKNQEISSEVKRLNAQREALNSQNPQRLSHPVIGKLAKRETTAESLKGQAIYELLTKRKSQAEASEYLKSLGIPGIKYFDAGSRDGGKGTRNFVVFPGEEKKVKILKRE